MSRAMSRIPSLIIMRLIARYLLPDMSRPSGSGCLTPSHSLSSDTECPILTPTYLPSLDELDSSFLLLNNQSDAAGRTRFDSSTTPRPTFFITRQRQP